MSYGKGLIGMMSLLLIMMFRSVEAVDCLQDLVCKVTLVKVLSPANTAVSCLVWMQMGHVVMLTM